MEAALPYRPLDRFLKFTLADIAKISFFFYFIIVVFGTSMPFQEKITRAEDIEASNPLNQLIYSTLYFISLVSLFGKRKQVYAFIKKEKYLGLFFLWCLASILWSDFPFVSFKRWLQIIGPAIVILAAFLHMDSLDEAIGYLKTVFMIYLPLSLLAIMVVPEASHWDMPAWRGLAPHKNTLGQICLFSAIIWVQALYTSATFKSRMQAMFFLGLSLVLLAGSRSMTSILAFSIWMAFAVLYKLDSSLSRLKIGRLYSKLILLLLGGLVIGALFIEPSLQEQAFKVLGKDASFTGRTDLWQAMLDEVGRHPWTGAGFSGFWVVGNDRLFDLYKEFPWFPNSAHQGYLDLLNEIGIIGLAIFLLSCVVYQKNVRRRPLPYFWTSVSAIVLLLNWQESTLFRMNTLTGIGFTMSYIALYVTLVKTNQPNSVRKNSKGLTTC
jgi:exopolysaccharide production protein ExoQ